MANINLKRLTNDGLNKSIITRLSNLNYDVMHLSNPGIKSDLIKVINAIFGKTNYGPYSKYYIETIISNILNKKKISSDESEIITLIIDNCSRKTGIAYNSTIINIIDKLNIYKNDNLKLKKPLLDKLQTIPIYKDYVELYGKIESLSTSGGPPLSPSLGSGSRRRTGTAGAPPGTAGAPSGTGTAGTPPPPPGP